MSLFQEKKSTEKQLREKLRKEFDIAARDVLSKYGDNDSMILGLMIEASIGSLYQGLKNSKEMTALCMLQDIDYHKILDEECKYVLNKYLSI